MPPVIPESDHGTVVLIDIQDPEVSNVGSIQTRLLTYVGRMYREMAVRWAPNQHNLGIKARSTETQDCDHQRPAMHDGRLSRGRQVRASRDLRTDHHSLQRGQWVSNTYTNPSNGRASEIQIKISRLRKHIVDDALMKKTLLEDYTPEGARVRQVGYRHQWAGILPA